MTYPIVLAHGIARFDVLLRAFLQDDAAGEDCTHYFRLIRSTLRTAGFDVHHSMVPWAEGLAVRSRVLRANVEAVLAATGAAKIHIVAHSMGGLDARRMLFDGQDDGLHKRIASVTTIGTPHNGTSFADWGVASQALLLAVMTQLGITTIDGVRDLTTDACTTFNDRAERFELGCGVAFRAHAGAQALPLVFEPMKLPWHIIKFHEGDNDGLVPVSSARWRPEFAAPAVLDADHLNQVGWWEPNDLGLTLGFTRFPPRLHLPESPEAVGRRIRGFYLELAQDLAKRFPTGA